MIVEFNGKIETADNEVYYARDVDGTYIVQTKVNGAITSTYRGKDGAAALANLLATCEVLFFITPRR